MTAILNIYCLIGRGTDRVRVNQVAWTLTRQTQPPFATECGLLRRQILAAAVVGNAAFGLAAPAPQAPEDANEPKADVALKQNRAVETVAAFARVARVRRSTALHPLATCLLAKVDVILVAAAARLPRLATSGLAAARLLRADLAVAQDDLSVLERDLRHAVAVAQVVMEMATVAAVPSETPS